MIGDRLEVGAGSYEVHTMNSFGPYLISIIL